MRHSVLYYPFLAVLSAIVMACIGPIARVSDIDAANLAFYRLGFGAVALLLLLAFKKELVHLKKIPHWTVLVNGILLSGFIFCFLLSIQTLALTTAIMLVYLAPACASILAYFWLKEPLSGRSLLLIGLAFFGVLLLQEFNMDLEGAKVSGVGFALLSLAGYSGFLILNKKTPKHQNQLKSTFYQLLIGACCLVPLVLNEALPPLTKWPWLVLAGLIPGALAIWCAITALSQLPARVYGTLAYTEPVVVVCFAVLLFEETLSLTQLTGIGLILFSGVGQACLQNSKH